VNASIRVKAFPSASGSPVATRVARKSKKAGSGRPQKPSRPPPSVWRAFVLGSPFDANPRLAETGNALAAGLNLPELLALVSLGRARREPARVARPFVADHPGLRRMKGLCPAPRAAFSYRRE
jgi:hypothetical protein